MMTSAERTSKRWRYLAIVAYFVLGYHACAWVNAQRTVYWTPFLPGERAIPFIPEAIFGYLLVYACMIGIYFVLADYRRFRQTWSCFAWVMTGHYVCYLLIPARMERPVILTTDFASRLTQAYYVMDQPFNVFPSLHVAFPYLATLCLWSYRRVWAWAFLVSTVIVATSVVLVKQHFLLDVAGTVILTGMIYWIKTRFRVEGSPSRSAPNS